MESQETLSDLGKKVPTTAEYVKRGRPPGVTTLVVNVRIPAAVYDRYCRCALRARQPVRSILRHILMLHAPSADENPPKARGAR